MTDIIKKKILEVYLKHAEDGRDMGLYFHVIAKELDFENKNVIVECRYLVDEGYLEEVHTMAFEKDTVISVRITALGKEALKTIFDAKWVAEEEQRKIKKEKLEERQINLAENTQKWTKITAAFAIAISTIALIVSVFKP